MGSRIEAMPHGTPRHRPLLLAGIVLALACVLAILAAAGAEAAGQRIEDRKRETRALRDNGRVDIIRASAARYGSDIRYRVTMRSVVKPARPAERPLLILNVRGGSRSDPEYLLLDETLFAVKENGDTKPIGSVRSGTQGRTWSLRFDPAQIPDGLGRYGWAVLTRTGEAEDVAPEDGYVDARA